MIKSAHEKKQEYIHKGIPFVQGHVRYGYKRVGKKKEARAVVDEEVRPIIARIFDWADEGLSIYQIDKLLTGTPAPGERKGDKTRRRQNGSWGPVAVGRILRDEIYAGTYWANREQVYEGEDGKKKKVARPREEWVAVPVPAIVDRDKWERVQKILDRGRRKRPKMHSKYDYLLARRVTCVPETDAAVWTKLRELITSPQGFLLRLRDTQAKQREAAQADDSELCEVEAQIAERSAELTVQVRKQVRAEAQRDAFIASIYQQVDQTRSTIEVLQKRKATLERRLKQKVISDEQIASIQALAEWAQSRLAEADENFVIRRQLIEAFDWRFTLLWRGKQRVVVVHWRDWDIEVEVNYRSRHS